MGVCLRLLAKPELGFVDPHPMQHDTEFASDSDTSARHAAVFCDLHAPCPQARPFTAAHQQAVRRLIKGGARQLVAASADPALDVGFTRLVAGGSEAKMRPNVPRASKTVRSINCRPKGKRRYRSNAGRTHQSLADFLLADNVEDMAGQASELAQHRA